METFHVVGGGGANLRALELMPDRSLNVLISAWSIHDVKNALRKHRDLVRRKAKLLMVDSGFLGAAKAGRMDWAGKQDLVVEYAEEFGADRVAMMDIPMEPEILRAAGFVRRDGSPDFDRALALTLENAAAFAQVRCRAARGFINQGWTMEHRQACLDGMTAAGVLPAVGWWGVGSVCRRRPPDLYLHAHWCRTHMEGPMHCFGISKAEWAGVMGAMGITAHDSATATLRTSFGRILVNGREFELGTRAIGGEQIRRNVRMNALLFWYNVEAINHEVGHWLRAGNLGWSPGPAQGRFDFGDGPEYDP